jgi:hexosaminidase
MPFFIAFLISSLIHIVPAPVKQVQHEGSFLVDEHTVVYVHQDAASLAEGAVSFLYDVLHPSTRLPLRHVTDCPTSGALMFALNTTLPPEGYTLSVTKDVVKLAAADAAGFFYGVQTLLQLFPTFVYRPVYEPNQYAAARHAVLPCVDISDYPRFSYRGMMLDVSRQFYTVDYVKKYLDWMAAHKLNRFHWHLADDTGWRVEIKKYPELTSKGAWRGPDEVISSIYGHAGKRYGGFYTQEEIKNIVAYAAARHIEIIPEIDLPGHSKAIIATYPHILCDLTDYEGLSIQGVSNNVWCASSEDNYRMLEDIVGEMVELFPSSFFHIGGDEVVTTQWTHCARCSAFMKEHGIQNPTEMQSYFVQRMQQILNKFDKTLVGWNEIMYGGELDRNKTVIHAWQSVQKIKEAAEKQYKIIAQPAQYCYLDMKHTLGERGMMWAAIVEVDQVYNFDPITTSGLTEEESSFVLGVQGGLWSELLDRPERIAEYQTYPRLCALSEVAWSLPEHKDWNDFHTRLEKSHFDRLYHMGIRFRIPPPKAEYINGCIAVEHPYSYMAIRYTSDGTEPHALSPLYMGPIDTNTPQLYKLAAFYKDDIKSTTVEVSLPEGRFQKPAVRVSGTMNTNPRTPLSHIEEYRNAHVFCYGPLEEGQYLQFDFEELVHTPGVRIQTGLPFVDINIIDFAHVEYSTDGAHFKQADCEWKNGGCRFVPPTPFRALRLVANKGNDALVYYLHYLRIEKSCL